MTFHGPMIRVLQPLRVQIGVRMNCVMLVGKLRLGEQQMQGRQAGLNILFMDGEHISTFPKQSVRDKKNKALETWLVM